MKQILPCHRLLATMFFLMVTTLCWAYSFAVNGIYYDKLGETSVAVTYKDTDYNSYSGSVVIPSTVTYGGKTYSVTGIGEGAFYGCTGLTSITIPNSVTSIDGNAFYGCSGLTSITIPESVTIIDDFAFYNCSGLTSVTIANSVTSIGRDAFQNCTGLTSITIPNSVTSIGSDAFSGCSGLTSVTIPNSVTSIGEFAFNGCSGLTSVTIGSGVTSIGEFAFYNCSGLTSVTIGSGVIGRYAFSGCSGLTSVTIGSGVIGIGRYAFSGCSGLTNIYSLAKNPPSMYTSIAGNNPIVYVPHGCKEKYTSSAYWKDFNIVEMVNVESVEIAKAQYDIIVGESKAIDVTVLPNTATYQKLEWQIDNPEIATIDNGIVTGKMTGQTKLMVTTTDGTNLSASCIISVTNPVQSISLSKTQLEFEVGDSETITASCTPANADDVTISWTSSDNSIVTVTNGNILAVGVGEAEIIAKSVDGIEARCTVVVKPTLATSISLNKHSLHLTTGLSEQLVLCVLPERTTNKAVTWSSTNPQIASVDEAGVVTANSNGSVTIKASTTDGSNLSDECTVIVTTVAREITLDRENASLIVGQTLTLVPTVIPVETSNKAVLWQSSNSNCATVSQEGKVSAIATGTAVIIATTTDGTNLSASCIINVINPVISLTLDRTCAELLVEQQITLNASCSPANADNQKVSWTTSNGEIATVSQDGIVTAMGEGDVAIIATTTDGTKLSASCQVHVKRHKQSIIWNQEALTCQEGGEMIVLEAESSSGLPVTFSSSDPDVLSIFDLGDVVYANPVKQGKAFVSVYQQGNYKYEPAEQAKEIEVLGKTIEGCKTLVAYYSQSALIDGIVAELTNQIAGLGNSVYTQKIEPSNVRINDANHDAYVRDSVMNVITLYPDDAVSYPEIKPLNVAVSDYDDIILVYPIWNMSMAAPMQTFCFNNRDILQAKSVAFVEYDLFDEAGVLSDAKVLRLSPSNIEDKSDLIKDWLDNSVATGILQFRHDKKESRDGIYDLQGRKISNPGKKGLYIIKGHKMLINDNGGTNR